MFRTRTKQAACALLLASITPLSLAQTGDFIFSAGFQDIADGPSTDAEAARFLTQATFGPTRAEIARLRQLGYRAWINEQLSLPATLSTPYLQSLVNDPTYATQFQLNSGHRVDRWMVQAVTAPDQLRQRMAYALSQIFVVADSGGIDTLRISEYQDLLATNAFNPAVVNGSVGTYRNLLGKVTFSVPMAQWLTYVRSRAAYQSNGGTVLPDENYAREVMQLFSFGLIKRNLDFSPVTAGGVPVPTYDQTDITELSRVFTGLSYPGSTSFGNSTGSNQALPMICFPMVSLTNQNFSAAGVTFHDLGAKTIFDNIALPAVTSNSQASCEAAINGALDQIANHPTVAPFISRQLIQRFITSNPSPAYIQRVATVFNNNGSGVRGDLGSVITAILLDPEARRLPSGSFGKLREPMLRLTANWRALDTVLGALEPPLNSNGTPNTSVNNRTMTLGFSYNEFLQRPLSSPTVFNFYEPDYQAPGPLQQAGLFSPEFQILNESSVARMNNTIRNRTADWFVGMTNPGATWPLVNLDPLANLITTWDATSRARLMDEINLRFMYGFMSNSMRNTMLTALAAQTAPTTEAQRRDIVRSMLRVVYNSPEYAVQK